MLEPELKRGICLLDPRDGGHRLLRNCFRLTTFTLLSPAVASRQVATLACISERIFCGFAHALHVSLSFSASRNCPSRTYCKALGKAYSSRLHHFRINLPRPCIAFAHLAQFSLTLNHQLPPLHHNYSLEIPSPSIPHLLNGTASQSPHQIFATSVAGTVTSDI